jgi:iron complex outermembrane receptor protein
MVMKTSSSKSVVRGLGLALLASTACVSGHAFAQQAPSTAPATTASAAQTGQNVETVIVTAEKRSERLIDVPTSISVVTAADIQDKTMIQLSDIAIQVPNVQFQGSSLFPNIAIRGVGSSSGTQTGVDPAAVVYVDGVYQGRERAENIPLAGIQQVEVLRGPQGTLYGENTIGGAINITTVKPDGEERAEGDIMFGNMGYVQTSAFVTGALTDNLFTAITGTYRNRDGFIHNDYDNSNLNYDRDMAGRVRFVWDATAHLSFDVSADYLHENDSESLLTTSYVFPYNLLFPGLPAIQPNSRTESVNSPEYGRRETYGGSVHAAYDFSWAKLDSITSYRGYTSAYGFDSDGTPISLDAENDLDNANLFTQEFRLTSTEAGPFQWILGAYYSHQRLVDSFDNIFYGPLASLFGVPLVGPGYTDQGTSRGRIISNEYALFANASYEITPRWKLDAGFRYTIDQKNLIYSQLETSLVGGPYGLVCGVLQCIPYANPHLEEHTPTGDVSLSYKIDDDQTAYVKFSRGYKAGGFNAYLNTNGFKESNFEFQPEYLNNYELGYKSSLWGGLVTFNGDVFYDDYTNKQEAVENIATVSLVVKNAAQATIYGAELEADVHPLDGLTLSGTLGLLHTRYGQFDNAGSSNACDCDTGNSLPGAPQLQGTIAAQYEHEIPSWDGWAGMIRLEGIHQSHSFTDAENDPDLINKPVSFLNGRLGVENGTWGFFLWGNNLTGTYALSGGLNELVAVARAVNLPTTYGGEITFKF